MKEKREYKREDEYLKSMRERRKERRERREKRERKGVWGDGGCTTYVRPEFLLILYNFKLFGAC